MRKLRAYLTPVLLVGVITLVFIQSWNAKSSIEQIQSEKIESYPSGTSLEERLLLMQAKLFIGAKTSFAKLFAKAGSPEMVAQLERTLQEVSSQVLKPHNDLTQLRWRHITRQRTIVAARLGNWTLVEEGLSTLETSERSEFETTLDSSINRILNEQRAGKVGEVDETEELLLSETLKDFFPLLLLEPDLSIPAEFMQDAERIWLRFFLGIVVVTSLLFIGLIAFIIFLGLYLLGKLRSKVSPPDFDSHLLGESFVLYLLGMLLAPTLIGELIDRGIISNPLKGNILIILSTVIAIFWPLFFGVRLSQLLRSVGLYFGGVRKFISDILIAPLFYLANWVVLLAVLVAYSAVLARLNIDLSQGAHPIVPLLLEAKDAQTPILIVILATLIAPLIEEIMFRGVLYGYLRSKLRALPAILISSLAFAVIHPQGLVGIVPLTAIGMMLATLREWRGGLVAPIIAHACVNGGTLAMLKLLFG